MWKSEPQKSLFEWQCKYGGRFSLSLNFRLKISEILRVKWKEFFQHLRTFWLNGMRPVSIPIDECESMYCFWHIMQIYYVIDFASDRTTCRRVKTWEEGTCPSKVTEVPEERLRGFGKEPLLQLSKWWVHLSVVFSAQTFLTSSKHTRPWILILDFDQSCMQLFPEAPCAFYSGQICNGPLMFSGAGFKILHILFSLALFYLEN